MHLGKTNPIGALCILCHDADAVLPFYRDVLGFEPLRAEESFYHFARRGTATALCLWEIGHVARHTTFSAHPESETPSKFMVSLTASSSGEAEALRQGLVARGVEILPTNSPDGDTPCFYFIDPCAVLWEVRADASVGRTNGCLALDRITLLCQDLAATAAFYEKKLGFPASEAAGGRITYPPINGTALSLWDAKAAAETIGHADLAKQRQHWSATTAMLAYSFDTLAEVRSLYEELGAAGVRFDEAPAHFDWDFSACYFRDPEDNIWELFETPGNIEQRMLRQNG